MQNILKLLRFLTRKHPITYIIFIRVGMLNLRTPAGIILKIHEKKCSISYYIM